MLVLVIAKIVLVMRVQMAVHDPIGVTMLVKVTVVRVAVSCLTAKITQREKRNPHAKKYERTARDIPDRRAQALRGQYSDKPHNQRQRQRR